MKREAELKSAVMRELHRQCPSWLVLLQATAGAPDRLIVGASRVSAWEFKHGTPRFISKGNQELFCMRLDQSGIRTRYVIWQESQTFQRTMIIHPKALHERDGWKVIPEIWCVGYDHRWLVSQIRKAHGV